MDEFTVRLPHAHRYWLEVLTEKRGLAPAHCLAVGRRQPVAVDLVGHAKVGDELQAPGRDAPLVTVRISSCGSMTSFTEARRIQA